MAIVEIQNGVYPAGNTRVDGLNRMLGEVQTASAKLQDVSSALAAGRRGDGQQMERAYHLGVSLLEEKGKPLPTELAVIGQNLDQPDVIDRFGTPKNPDAKLGTYADENRLFVHTRVVFNGNKPISTAWKEEVDAHIENLRTKELRILELSLHERGLLAPFAAVVDRFYANGTARPRTQIIPDTLDVPFGGPVMKVFQERGVLEQDPTRLGLHEGEKDQKRALEKVHESYEEESKRTKRSLYGFIHGWLTEHPDIEITSDKLQTVNEIIDIVYKDTLQISESSLHWTALYALKSVFGNTPEEDRDPFVWTLAMGGDQVPPPYVESYVVEPLSKLSALQRLQDQGRLSFVPDFNIVATYHSQVRENRKDKAGHEINPDLHVYNSRVTVERLHEFIEQFYPEVADKTHFVELPDYHQTGPARLLFATLWRRISHEGPLSDEALAGMFHIKGDVQEDGHTAWGGDPVIEFFHEDGKPDVNPYVIRHLFSNMLFANAHTLRWGAWRTEPQFHVVPMQVLTMIRRDRLGILQELASSTEQVPHISASEAVDQAMRQLKSAPNVHFVKAQNGLSVHASYYKHRDEPSLEDIVESGSYSAQRLRDHDRGQKADELEHAFGIVVTAVGHDAYIDFLRRISDTRKYAPYDVDRLNLLSAREAQERRMEEYLVSGENARHILQFYLS